MSFSDSFVFQLVCAFLIYAGGLFTGYAYGIYSAGKRWKALMDKFLAEDLDED